MREGPVRRTHGGRRARRGRGERGAALIEFALLAPVLIALLLGIIDFGVGFNDWISLRQGAREGARQAVTGRLGSDTDCAIQPGSPAFPASTQVNELVCLVKDRLALDASKTAVKLVIEGTYAEEKSLSVCAMTRLRSITGLYSALLDDQVLQTAVQMKTEQTIAEATGVSETLTNWQEAPITGGSWTFCSLEPTS